MADSIVKALINKEVLMIACSTKELVIEGNKLHQLFPIGTAVLGRILTAGALFGKTLKEKDQKVTISLNGGGPAGTVMVTADEQARVKGYVANRNVNIPPGENGVLSVDKAVGTDGFVTVVKDIGFKEPYVGKTKIVSGQIAEDLAYYMLQSEQQPSIVYLNVWINGELEILTAGGYLILPLPGASEETLSAIEQKSLALHNYGIMLLSKTPVQIIRETFEGQEVQILEEAVPKYYCECSKDRMAQALACLGKAEIEDMIEKDGGAEIVCRFCDKKYQFSAQDLRDILHQATGREN